MTNLKFQILTNLFGYQMCLAKKKNEKKEKLCWFQVSPTKSTGKTSF